MIADGVGEGRTVLYMQAVDQIEWPEGFVRRDIGWRAVRAEKAGN